MKRLAPIIAAGAVGAIALNWREPAGVRTVVGVPLTNAVIRIGWNPYPITGQQHINLRVALPIGTRYEILRSHSVLGPWSHLANAYQFFAWQGWVDPNPATNHATFYLLKQRP